MDINGIFDLILLAMVLVLLFIIFFLHDRLSRTETNIKQLSNRMDNIAALTVEGMAALNNKIDGKEK